MLAFRRMLEAPSISFTMRLDRRSGWATSTGVDGLDLAGILIILGLDCWNVLKDEFVGVKTGGALFGERGLFPAEQGRETSSAAGGPFLVPLSIVLLCMFVARGGSGGGSSVGCRLVKDADALDLGFGNV